LVGDVATEMRAERLRSEEPKLVSLLLYSIF
jgi:hypothetical protein